MNTQEIAKKVYEEIAAEDYKTDRAAAKKQRSDTPEDPPEFEDLGKSVKANFMEITEAGGDASRFGQKVREIIRENKAAAKTEAKPEVKTETKGDASTKAASEKTKNASKTADAQTAVK